MLVLQRQVGDSIVIAGDITVHVISIEDGQIRIGIDAPPEVVILRSELAGRQHPLDAISRAASDQRDLHITGRPRSASDAADTTLPRKHVASRPLPRSVATFATERAAAASPTPLPARLQVIEHLISAVGTSVAQVQADYPGAERQLTEVTCHLSEASALLQTLVQQTASRLPASGHEPIMLPSTGAPLQPNSDF